MPGGNNKDVAAKIEAEGTKREVEAVQKGAEGGAAEMTRTNGSGELTAASIQ